MVADQRAQRAEKKASWRRAIRDGLDSLTVTGPSAVLDEMCREARERVENLPTQQETEAALSHAREARERAHELWMAGDWAAARQAREEMQGHLDTAFSGYRRS